MKTVLLPIDFSNNSWNAVFTAIKLFHKIPSRFVLMHAYQTGLQSVTGDSGEHTMVDIYESLKKEAEEEMQKALEYLAKEHQDPRHTCEGHCLRGDLVHTIEQSLERDPVDMIVMGTQGATGARRVFMGSNTVRTLKNIRNKPILAVPGAYDLQQLKDVVFPTDYLQPVESYELGILMEILQEWRARLHVVYVSEEARLSEKQQANKDLLEHHLADVRTVFEEIPLKDSLSETLTAYGRALHADIIALVHRKHHLLDKLIREPVVKRMAFQGDMPLLILPKLG